jgi:TP901 family phage tail tape measure protein
MLVKIAVDDGGNVAIQKLATNVSKAQPKVKSLGDTMRNAFAVIGVYKGINMLSAKLMQATDEALKFEKAMKKIKAIGNESAGTMGKMEKEIEKFALTTEHSFTQIAEAQLGISKAGIRGSEGMEVLKNALDLATVSGEEQGAVSEGLINILNTFGMGTDKASYAANVMSRALNETVLNLEDYLYAMTYAAPVANQLGVSFEELSAMIGILAQTGQKGSLAGTGIRNILLNMLKLTPEVAEALKEVKIEEMGVTQLLELLNKNGLPVVDLLKQFNKRGILAAAALGDNADKVYDLQKRLTDLSRPLSTVADEMRDNLLDKLQMLNDHFVMILNTLNKEMGKGGVTVLDNLMAKIVDFNETLKNNPKLLADYTKAFVALGKTLNALIPIITFAAEHSKELLAAFAINKLINITNQIAIFGRTLKTAFLGAQGSVGLLIASLTTLYLLANDIAEKFKEMRMAEKFSDSTDPVVKRINTLETLIELYEKVEGGTGNVTDILPEIKNLENRMLSLGTQIKFTGDRQVDLNQAYEEYNKIMRSSTSVTLGKDEKPKPKPKPFGSNLTLPKDKEDKNKFDDAYGKIFDMHSFTVKSEQFKSKVFDTFKIDKETGKSILGELFNVENTVYADWTNKTLKKLQAEFTDLIIPADVEANDEAKREIENFVEDSLNELKKLQEVEINPYAGIEKFADIYSVTLDVYNPIMDSISERQEYLHTRQLEIYNEEMQAVTDRYNTEMAAAGDSAMQKTLAENKYQKEQKKINAKIAAENKKAAQANWKASMIQIALNGGTMTSNFINALSKQMPPYVAIPLGIGLAAGVTTTQLAITAANNPADAYYTGGWVKGNGNSTSDSVNIRASKGEYVLSRDDIDRLGGDSAINRMVSFGGTDNKSTSIYIDTIIGEETYVRKNILPRIRAELKR